MTTPHDPFAALRENLEKIGQNVSRSLEDASRIAAAQGAMGWMMRGDLEKARAVLSALSGDRLSEISATAAALAALADEMIEAQR